MQQTITDWMVANQGEILASLILPYVAFTLSKFPDPREFEGKWYYPFYYGFFMLATHYSSGDWRKWGVGKPSLPFTQSPKLKEVEPPMAFTMPKFHEVGE